VFADVPEGGDQARLGAHVNVFCEVDEGCDPADEACRREGMVLWPRPGTSVLHVPLDKSVLTDELSPELRPAYDAWILAWKSGNGELAVGCPEGTEQACTSDWYGSTGHIQPSSACWCTEVGAAQPLLGVAPCPTRTTTACVGRDSRAAISARRRTLLTGEAAPCCVVAVARALLHPGVEVPCCGSRR
jgi:hypothetical protein